FSYQLDNGGFQTGLRDPLIEYSLVALARQHFRGQDILRARTILQLAARVSESSSPLRLIVPDELKADSDFEAFTSGKSTD
ncbi:MAG: hypothetical protein KDA96_21090, partial [Planctomycetaceae bacterium]|nr:hypothetical protein [Planctomycetaceae bacterium]